MCIYNCRHEVYSTPHDVHDPQLGGHWATPLLQHIFEATTQNETRAVFCLAEARANGISERKRTANLQGVKWVIRAIMITIMITTIIMISITITTIIIMTTAVANMIRIRMIIIVILMIITLRIKNSKLRKFALKNRPTQLGDSGCSPTFSTWHGTWFACGGSSQRKHHSCLTRVELHHPHVFLQNMSKHLSLVNCHSISTPWVVMWFTHIYIYIRHIYTYI